MGACSRPQNAAEQAAGEEPAFRWERRQGGGTVVIHDPAGEKPDVKHDYDVVFDASSTQEAVYNELGKPLLEQAFAGFNSTVLAYGQTSSGKTHTMIGDDAGEQEGCQRRVVDVVLELSWYMYRGLKASEANASLASAYELEGVGDEMPPQILNQANRALPRGQQHTLTRSQTGARRPAGLDGSILCAPWCTPRAACAPLVLACMRPGNAGCVPLHYLLLVYLRVLMGEAPRDGRVCTRRQPAAPSKCPAL